MSIGITFPFSLSTGSLGYVELTDDDVSAIKSNLKSLLATNWGERPMHPDLGCNMDEFVFSPLTQALRAPIADRIQSQLAKWMPFLVLEELGLVFSEQDAAVPQNGFRVDLTVSFSPGIKIRVSQVVSQ